MMNALRNKVSLIGRLGGQPELVKLESGKTMTRFSLATNESYKNKDGEWQDSTQWHNLTAWGRTADLIVAHLKKGQEVIIEGKLINRTLDGTDGTKRHFTNVEVNEFLALSQAAQAK